jgi:hypothetical protein
MFKNYISVTNKKKILIIIIIIIIITIMKVNFITCHEGPDGQYRYSSTLF